MTEPTTTIQQTAKGWKAAQLGGVLLLCAGVVGIVAGGMWAAPVVLLGGLIYAVGRAGAWWHHG